MGLEKDISYCRTVLSGLPVPHLFWIEIFHSASLCNIVLFCVVSSEREVKINSRARRSLVKWQLFIVTVFWKER